MWRLTMDCFMWDGEMYTGVWSCKMSTWRKGDGRITLIFMHVLFNDTINSSIASNVKVVYEQRTVRELEGSSRGLI
jgi:hypothetical protein